MRQTHCSGRFRLPPNSALKPTRLWACLPHGRASAENAAAHGFCTQSAVQLNGGVRQQPAEDHV
jgi:hypothetical protein